MSLLKLYIIVSLLFIYPNIVIAVDDPWALISIMTTKGTSKNDTDKACECLNKIIEKKGYETVEHAIIRRLNNPPFPSLVFFEHRFSR